MEHGVGRGGVEMGGALAASFTPGNSFWSGSLPVLELDADQETEARSKETKENTAKEERALRSARRLQK